MYCSPGDEQDMQHAWRHEECVHNFGLKPKKTLGDRRWRKENIKVDHTMIQCEKTDWI